jgi:hypothetical protein
VILEFPVRDVFEALQPAGLGDRRYYSTILHAIILGTDVVSIAIFLLGKSRFTISTPMQGIVLVLRGFRSQSITFDMFETYYGVSKKKKIPIPFVQNSESGSALLYGNHCPVPEW